MNILSFLFPVTIVEKISSSGEVIRVVEIAGQRRLTIAGYPQSNPLFRWMWSRLIKNMNLAPRGKVLILGLGGGDLVKLFTNKFPSWKITVVELDPEIICVARECFGVSTTKNVKVIHDNAKNYVDKTRTKFDLIIEDIYVGDNIPKWITRKIFIHKMIKMLRRKGRLIFNYASFSFKERDYEMFRSILNNVNATYREKIYFGHRFFICE